MLIKRVEMPKKGFESYEDGALNDYEIEKIHKSIVELWYWYGPGDYSGAGNAIYLCSNGKWDRVDMGHCSCYGPTDCLDSLKYGLYSTWQELVATFSEELKTECAPIIEALKNRESHVTYEGFITPLEK